MQDVLRSQALLLLIILMRQKLKPQQVHPELVLLFSHTEGLLDINFLQYLEPDTERTQLTWFQGTEHYTWVRGHPRAQGIGAGTTNKNPKETPVSSAGVEPLEEEAV